MKTEVVDVKWTGKFDHKKGDSSCYPTFSYGERPDGSDIVFPRVRVTHENGENLNCGCSCHRAY